MLDDAELLFEDLEEYGDWRSRPIGKTVARQSAALERAPDSCVKRGETWWVRRADTAYEILREEKRDLPPLHGEGQTAKPVRVGRGRQTPYFLTRGQTPP